jgi:hypothetical protein
VELEIASTVGFFENQGKRPEIAIEQTKYMKPTKAIPKIMEKAEGLLNQLKTEQRSAPTARRTVR